MEDLEFGSEKNAQPVPTLFLLLAAGLLPCDALCQRLFRKWPAIKECTCPQSHLYLSHAPWWETYTVRNHGTSMLCFPPLWHYLSKQQQSPGILKGPITHPNLFTRVQGDTVHSFPSISILEHGMIVVLVSKATFISRRKPVPPSSGDQVTVCLKDWAYQCAAQTAAAWNNVLLLTFLVMLIAAQPGALPTELATKISKATSAILTLCIAAEMKQSHI